MGIGVQLDRHDEPQSTVFHDSPADKAGLRTGDVILEVDGVPAAGSSLDDVVGRIRGEAGTAVELTVRAGEDGTPRTLKIVRGEVEIDAVSTVVPGTTTGLLRIEQFSNGVAEDVQTALQELRKEGADRLVLDLRGNPGGYVGEAVGAASQFLSSGTVYVERNAQGEEKATPVSPDGVWTDLPLIVLVDEGSASAVGDRVGRLQDNDRGGARRSAPDGPRRIRARGRFGAAIGTVEWLTPDGRRIWHEGIEPDVAVARATEALPTLPDDVRDLAPARVASTVDAQLGRALELIEATDRSGRLQGGRSRLAPGSSARRSRQRSRSSPPRRRDRVVADALADHAGDPRRDRRAEHVRGKDPAVHDPDVVGAEPIRGQGNGRRDGCDVVEPEEDRERADRHRVVHEREEQQADAPEPVVDQQRAWWRAADEPAACDVSAMKLNTPISERDAAADWVKPCSTACGMKCWPTSPFDVAPHTKNVPARNQKSDVRVARRMIPASGVAAAGSVHRERRRSPTSDGSLRTRTRTGATRMNARTANAIAATRQSKAMASTVRTGMNTSCPAELLAPKIPFTRPRPGRTTVRRRLGRGRSPFPCRGPRAGRTTA